MGTYWEIGPPTDFDTAKFKDLGPDIYDLFQMTTAKKVSSPIAWIIVCLSALFIGCPNLCLQACSKFSSFELSVSQNPNDQNDNSVAASLIISLSSTDIAVRTDAEEKLIDFARTSGARRQLIIKELLRSGEENRS